MKQERAFKLEIAHCFPVLKSVRSDPDRHFSWDRPIWPVLSWVSRILRLVLTDSMKSRSIRDWESQTARLNAYSAWSWLH